MLRRYIKNNIILFANNKCSRMMYSFTLKKYSPKIEIPKLPENKKGEIGMIQIISSACSNNKETILLFGSGTVIIGGLCYVYGLNAIITSVKFFFVYFCLGLFLMAIIEECEIIIVINISSFLALVSVLIYFYGIKNKYLE
jgi:hypothetical protein